MQRHRHQEFIRFLNIIEAQVPAGKVIHVIIDNYAAHKHPKVMAWLDRYPRWQFPVTPTSCSWLNAVRQRAARDEKVIQAEQKDETEKEDKMPSNPIR